MRLGQRLHLGGRKFCTGARMGAAALRLLACAEAVSAAEQSVPVQTNVPVEINLPWPYAEEDLQEPRGYNHHGAQAGHILRELVIENTGPAPFTGGEVLVDGTDWRTELAPIGRDFAPALFTTWTQARSHATSGTKAAENPWQMLRFWGYSLCGEDTKSLNTLMAERQIAGRPVPLNGHVAAEYLVDGRWTVLDGDQNLVYLNLDNRTLAGFAEIRADPFLALRTKPFGRYERYSLEAAQFNAGLFDYLAKETPKPYKKRERAPGDLRGPVTLWPGERLTYHYVGTPKDQVGNSTDPAWRSAGAESLRIMGWQLQPKGRGAKDQALSLVTTYPILAAQNLTTGAWAVIPGGEPQFACTVPIESASDQVTVWMQRSQVSLPNFHPGKNLLTIRADEAGAPATVRLIYEIDALPPRPERPEIDAVPVFREGLPSFPVKLEAGCDQLWWQIASDPKFRFIAPSLEQIQPAAAPVALDALAATFLNGGTDYFIRVKAARQGVWSDWSAVQAFQVEKPRAPSALAVHAAAGGKVALTWQGEGEEFAVFASNRLDFLPELFTEKQITAMRGLEVLGQRENRNRVAAVPEPRCEFTPTGRFVRVMARRGAAWSNPSALLTLPPEFCRGLPPPVVFELSWSRVDGHDLHVGEERPLPP